MVIRPKVYLDQAPLGRLIQWIKRDPTSDGFSGTEQFACMILQQGEPIKDQAYTLIPDFPLKSDPIFKVGSVAE